MLPVHKRKVSNDKMNASPILSLRNVDVFYGNLQILSSISLDVFDREIVSIVGSENTGKTTLLRAIMGLRIPKNGTVTFLGGDITDIRAPGRVQKGIAYVPCGDLILPDLSVEENLGMDAYSRKQIRQTNPMLERQYALFPQLREQRTVPAGLLSARDRRILAVSKELMADPRLLLLDGVTEPEFGDIVGRIHSETGTAIVAATRDASAALSISHRVYFLNNGVVTAGG